MKVIHGLQTARTFKNAVVALGVFDGVHRGHRKIIAAAVTCAERINGTSIVVTFWPHPQKDGMLFSLAHRLRLIAGLGVDVCIVVNFSRHFAKISADDFIRDVLYRKLRTRYLYVGKNFHFGCHAQGDERMLRACARIYGYEVRVFEVAKIRGRPISSTYIRNLIGLGDLNRAKEFLAHPVSVLGTVVKGASLARKLGFPTANIDPHHEIIPPSGIYAVRVLYGMRSLSGICYIGTKPTIRRSNALRKVHVEVHIFDFSANLYGQDLEVQFIALIRRDQKFATLDSLREAIIKDVVYARRITRKSL